MFKSKKIEEKLIEEESFKEEDREMGLKSYMETKESLANLRSLNASQEEQNI